MMHQTSDVLPFTDSDSESTTSAVHSTICRPRTSALRLSSQTTCTRVPGGRLREQDFDVSLELVIERKVREELGEEVKCKLDAPEVFMRHERNEILGSGDKCKRRIFAIGYAAKYYEGKIKLGKNHENYEWVPVRTFKPESKFTGGWLKGIKDFQASYKNSF